MLSACVSVCLSWKADAVLAGAVSRMEWDFQREYRPKSRLSEMYNIQSSFGRMLTGIKAFSKFVPLELVKRIIGENQVRTAQVARRT